MAAPASTARHYNAKHVTNMQLRMEEHCTGLDHTDFNSIHAISTLAHFKQNIKENEPSCS